jgi:putative cardiolipin synthase
MHKIALFSLFLISSFTVISDSHAKIYPWYKVDRADIKLTADSQVEAEVRLNLISKIDKLPQPNRGAPQSISILTFDQRVDENVGMPLLRELGKAASNGVFVRIATSWGAQAISDPQRKLAGYLDFLSRQYPDHFHYLIAGGPTMQKRGWTLSDSNHAKIGIINNKVGFITGRGHAGAYLDWLDTFVTLKGNPVEDLVDLFERVWERLEVENPKDHWASHKTQQSKTFPGGISEEEFWLQEPSQPNPLTRLETQEKKVKSFLNWAKLPPSQQISHPTWIRVLDNDFFEKMKSSSLDRLPKAYNFLERQEIIQDDILNSAIEEISQAESHIRIYSLALLMSDSLKAALIAAQERGVDVQIITNGIDSHSQLFADLTHILFRGWLRVPFGAGYYLSKPDAIELLSAGIKVYVLNVSDSYVHLHRKMWIIDDNVFLGSHNATLASETVQFEANLQIQDSAISNKWLGEFDRDVSPAYADQMDLDSILAAENGPIWSWCLLRAKECFASFFKGAF